MIAHQSLVGHVDTSQAVLNIITRRRRQDENHLIKVGRLECFDRLQAHKLPYSEARVGHGCPFPAFLKIVRLA
jgi:hypothetical protein